MAPKMNGNSPKHIAIIMDGNRRWAAKRSLGPVDGHRIGAEKTIKPIVKRAIKRGVEYLTFWAFSSENRSRDKAELRGLFNIFREALKTNLFELEKLGVKIQIVGDINWFPRDIAKLTKSTVRRTKDNGKITVSFAINYGGREEILRAVSRLIQKIRAHKRSLKASVTEKEFAGLLDTAGMPDPDLVIRTGGNLRLSGYFPWQTIYSELYFTKTLWPDFSPSKFDKILENYSKRTRRFGGGRIADYVGKVTSKARSVVTR